MPSSTSALIAKAIEATRRAPIRAEEQMTAQLQQAARGAGWPPAIVQRLSVRHEDGSFQIHIPPSVEAQVHDLEYGTLTTAPQAVLRQFHNRMGQIADAAAAATFKEVMA